MEWIGFCRRIRFNYQLMRKFDNPRALSAYKAWRLTRGHAVYVDPVRRWMLPPEPKETE